jgi:hypothetical protein
MYVAGNFGNKSFPEIPELPGHFQKLQAFTEIPKHAYAIEEFFDFFLIFLLEYQILGNSKI